MVGGQTDAAGRIAEATATCTLPDGRTLAYTACGDPSGQPVVVFHGGIGSRGFGFLFDDAARDAGVRVIAPDRPGYGRSDPKPNRMLLDWPADLVALADSLAFDRFAVLGVSGGGPYAAACAYALPSRVSAAALVSSMGPPAAPRPIGLRVIVLLARFTPRLVAVILGRTLRRARTNPDAAMARRAKGKPAPEAAMHRSEAGRILTASTAEAGRQGAGAAAREIAIIGGPWGFDLANVPVPVGIWHGALDGTVPVDSAEYVADAIPDARLTVHDDVGHLSLPVTYASEILAFLKAPDAPA